jgi:hypothetical protein
VRGCSNHKGFPYKRLEALLYRVRETYLAIAETLPKLPDESANRLAELEERSARIGERIDALIDELEITPSGPVREAVQRRLGQRNDEQLKLRKEISEARVAVRVATSVAVQDVNDRFAEARTALDADDPAVRRDARIRVAAEYQRVIEQMILHPDRRITVQIKPGTYGNRVEYLLSPDKIEELRVTLPNGQTIPSKAMLFDCTMPEWKNALTPAKAERDPSQKIT